jgi:hypothetical protein
LLIVEAKREKNEDDNQHEDCDHEDQCNYKHKRCRMRTTKIKITMIRKVVVNNYSKERGEGR